MVRNDVAVKAVTVVEKNNSEPAIPSSFLVVERSIAKIVFVRKQAFEFECHGMRTTPFSPLTVPATVQ